jgi:hypothetical protein
MSEPIPAGRLSPDAQLAAPSLADRAHVATVLAGLRDVLTSAGFTRPRIDALTQDARAVGDRLRPAARRVVLEETPDPALAVLVRLFDMAETLPVGRLHELVPDLDLDGLADLGLLVLSAGEARPLIRIGEFDGLLVSCDANLQAHDCVSGPSRSSQASAACTPRAQVGGARDLGPGGGLQARRLARHSGTVVATDVNTRALVFTELNARLNDLPNIELREGSFIDPVADEKFDLVVANPPYVISPDRQFAFRDAGFDGDELSRMMLTELPWLLNEGGMATLQGNWIHRADEQWFAVPGSLLADTGCDSLMLRAATRDALAYAVEWAQSDHLDPDEYEQTVRRWHESYRAAGTERISGALIVMRLRGGGGGANWHTAATAMAEPAIAMGDSLPAMFSAHDRLNGLTGDALADVRVSAAEGLGIELPAPASEVTLAWVSCPAAFGTRRAVSTAVALGLASLAGERSLREVLGAALSAAKLEELRVLVTLGYLRLQP